jgi:hypothetical protein
MGQDQKQVQEPKGPVAQIQEAVGAILATFRPNAVYLQVAENGSPAMLFTLKEGGRVIEKPYYAKKGEQWEGTWQVTSEGNLQVTFRLGENTFDHTFSEKKDGAGFHQGSGTVNGQSNGRYAILKVA